MKQSPYLRTHRGLGMASLSQAQTKLACRSERCLYPNFRNLRKHVTWSRYTTDIVHGCEWTSSSQYQQRLTHDGRYAPVPETELSDILSRIYDRSSRIYDQAVAESDPTESHRLAVLYMVFAIGTLMDLEQPSLSVASTQFYQMARAALSLDSVLENQSLHAIEALVSGIPACPDIHGVLLISD